MKNIIVVLLLTVVAFASTRFVHFSGMGLSEDAAIENGDINLRMICVGDPKHPVGEISNEQVVSIQHHPTTDIYYYAEMTATCTTISSSQN